MIDTKQNAASLLFSSAQRNVCVCVSVLVGVHGRRGVRVRVCCLM